MTPDDAIASIIAAPDDLGRWALLSDLLQQQGDPRGELIALDLAFETAAPKRRTELSDTRAKYLAAHGPSLFGELLAKVAAEGYCTTTWRRGFLDSLSYVGDASLGYPRAVGWLVKAVCATPAPFAFIRRFDFTLTDLKDPTPLTIFKTLEVFEAPRSEIISIDWASAWPKLTTLNLRHCEIPKVSVAEFKKQHPRARVLHSKTDS